MSSHTKQWASTLLSSRHMPQAFKMSSGTKRPELRPVRDVNYKFDTNDKN